MRKYRYTLLWHLLAQPCLWPTSCGVKLSSKTVVSVQKCCYSDELINFYNPAKSGSSICMPNTNFSSGWKPQLYNRNLKPLARKEYDKLDIQFRNDTFELTFNDSDLCPEMYESFEPYYILKNGSLYQENMAPTTLYCIDHAYIKPGVSIETALLRCTVRIHHIPQDISVVLNKTRGERMNVEYEDVLIANITTIAYYIYNDKDQCVFAPRGTVVHHIFNFLMITSNIFLIITFTVYMTNPDLRNLHGKIVIGNVTSMFLVYVYLLIVYIFKFIPGSNSCIVLGYIGYFLVISMFGWLTIMCYEIFWTFSRTKAPTKDYELVKFILYSMGVYGISIVLTITIVMLNQFHPKESRYNPKVGSASCFIHPDAMGMVIHLPILIFMVINSILYILTILTLCCAKHNIKGEISLRRTNAVCGNLPKDQNKKMKNHFKIIKDTTKQLVVYIKLFLVMGILWIFEAIHYYVHRCHDDNTNNASEIFFRTIDAINLLRGFIFFVIFVCKPDIWKNLRKVPIMIRILGSLKTGTIGSRSNKSTKSTTDSNSTVRCSSTDEIDFRNLVKKIGVEAEMFSEKEEGEEEIFFTELESLNVASGYTPPANGQATKTFQI